MRVVIVGGGISGLAAAYRLCQSEPGRRGELEIHVFEASDHFGGVIQTRERDGFLMELGPDAFISAKPWGVELCRQIGMDQEFLETNPGRRQSFILSKNKLVPVPRGFYLMTPTKVSDVVATPLLSPAGKIRMACELFVPPKKTKGDESLASFVRRRFGRETLERIAQPMIAGIYTADPDELSLDATFPHFLEMEEKYGSVIRAFSKKKDAATSKASGPRYSLFLSLKDGMQSLPESLIQKMPEVHFHPSTPITAIEKGLPWKIWTQKGEKVSADVLCLALPACATARLLKSVSAPLTELLEEIPYENVATVNLAFHRKEVKHPLNGLGYVVPAIEKKKIVGCTFSNIKFPVRGKSQEDILLRAFVGGKDARPLLEQNDDQVIESVCQEIGQQLGISSDPFSIMLQRWPEAIPQYRVNHRLRVQKIFSELRHLPGFYLTGNGYTGIGIPDCIHHASQTVSQILDDLRAVQSIVY